MELKENDICPNCSNGQLELINANYPFNEEEYLQCNNCDSIYLIDVDYDQRSCNIRL